MTDTTTTSSVPTDHRVDYDVEEGIALVTINRPPVNALSSQMYRGLCSAAEQIAADENVRVAILTGAGPIFSGGADVKELAAHTPAEKEAFTELSLRTRRLFRTIPVPVISAINGPAAGAGVLYSAYCDYRIAATGSFLSLPEINVGSVAGGGEQLMWLGIPQGAIRHMLYTACRIPAEEAVRLHLVDELAPAGGALDLARERAREIAQRPRSALVAMKRAILEASDRVNSVETYRSAAAS
jgi:enoyl-CoA hydratase